MRKYKAIGFDMDGTLIDNHAMRDRVARRLIERKHIEATVAEVREELVENYFRQLSAKTEREFCLHGQKYPYHPMAELMEDEYCNHAIWLPGAEEFLCALKREGFMLFIITNGEHDFQQKKIDSLHMERYFDCWFISCDVGVHKPDPAIFRFAENQMELKPEEYLFIGDREETDVKGARLAGVDSVNMLNPKTSEATYTADGYHNMDALMEICKISAK